MKTYPQVIVDNLNKSRLEPFIKSLDKMFIRRTYHLRDRDKQLLKSLLQNITGEDLTGQVTINLANGGINSVESTQVIKDCD